MRGEQLVGLVVLVALVLGALWHWTRLLRLKAAISSGNLEGFGHFDLAPFLYSEYGRGVLHPRAMEAAASLAPPTIDPWSSLLNKYICVEVAAGRYREALAWRGRWAVQPRRAAQPLLAINEAEALACLGQLEESLRLIESQSFNVDWIASGGLSHRIWVLAELGRVEEARRLMEDPLLTLEPFPADFEAERHFCRFAVGLAARDFELAHSALRAASRVIVRESSRRNLRFYRGRLALAEGRPLEAFEHFEAAAQSAYKYQGGAALLEWGDALQRLGRVDEAREKWQWCSERDPQSPAAATARARLKQDAAA